MFCIFGHDNSMQKEDIFGDGIIYYGVTCVSDRQYMLFNINKEGYSHEIVSY